MGRFDKLIKPFSIAVSALPFFWIFSFGFRLSSAVRTVTVIEIRNCKRDSRLESEVKEYDRREGIKDSYDTGTYWYIYTKNVISSSLLSITMPKGIEMLVPLLQIVVH